MYPEDFRAYTDKTVEHMEHFAKEGFRTLVLAYRVISEEDYRVWLVYIKLYIYLICISCLFLIRNGVRFTLRQRRVFKIERRTLRKRLS